MMLPLNDMIPIVFSGDWWEGKTRPKRILHQKFGTVLSEKDLSLPEVRETQGFESCPRLAASVKASGASEVKNDKDEFVVTLEVDDFKPEELVVTTEDNYVEVHGKQEDRRDEYGLVSREFRRRYLLPCKCNIMAVAASLSDDGKLTIRVPACKEKRNCQPRIVPVEEKEVEKLRGDVTMKDIRKVVEMSYPNVIEATREETPEEKDVSRMYEDIRECQKLAQDTLQSIHEMFPVTDESAVLPPESQGAVLPPESQGADLPPESQGADLPPESSTVEAKK